MSHLISPNQVSFVPGRHISDNIMIAQEMLHKCKKSTGKKGFIIWKVDLSKAYDKLRWSFIEKVLYEIQLPTDLVKIIMSCVTSTSFQVVVNGDLSESFYAQKGIRQGDPSLLTCLFYAWKSYLISFLLLLKLSSGNPFGPLNLVLQFPTCFLQMIWSYLLKLLLAKPRS